MAYISVSHSFLQRSCGLGETAVDELIRKDNAVRVIKITEQYKLLIQYVVNTFVRPADLRVLSLLGTHFSIQIFYLIQITSKFKTFNFQQTFIFLLRSIPM